MKITKETIPLIEKTLNINLYPWQKEWLINGTPFPYICPCLIYDFKESIVESCVSQFDGKRCNAIKRMIGKTTIHCINLALSDGFDKNFISSHSGKKVILKKDAPININEMELYSDYGDGSIRYSRGFYKGMFLEIWNALKDVGLPVRKLRS